MRIGRGSRDFLRCGGSVCCLSVRKGRQPKRPSDCESHCGNVFQRHAQYQLRELTYTDFANRQSSGVIALQPDQAGRRQAVVGVSRKFARATPALPVSALELIFDDFAAIEPMLYMGALDNESCLVPMIERPHDTGRGAVDRVGARGGREAAAAVRRIRVIEELIFRSAPIDMIVLACAPVKDTAIATPANLPLEFELEVSEGLIRHQLLDRPLLG